jgi:hypothetical protein
MPLNGDAMALMVLDEMGGEVLPGGPDEGRRGRLSDGHQRTTVPGHPRRWAIDQNGQPSWSGFLGRSTTRCER